MCKKMYVSILCCPDLETKYILVSNRKVDIVSISGGEQ